MYIIEKIPKNKKVYLILHKNLVTIKMNLPKYIIYENTDDDMDKC